MTKTIFNFLALNQSYKIFSNSIQIKFAKNNLSSLKIDIEKENFAKIMFYSILNISNGSSKDVFYQKVKKIFK